MGRKCHCDAAKQAGVPQFEAAERQWVEGSIEQAVLDAAADLPRVACWDDVAALTKNTTKEEYVKGVTVVRAQVFGGGRVEQTDSVLVVCVYLFDASGLDIQSWSMLQV